MALANILAGSALSCSSPAFLLGGSCQTLTAKAEKPCKGPKHRNLETQALAVARACDSAFDLVWGAAPPLSRGGATFGATRPVFIGSHSSKWLTEGVSFVIHPYG